MSDKKHIDRLFQEKLKDFEQSPSDAVWKNINSQLQQTSVGKKPIPLWVKIGGVAAGLFLLVVIGDALINTNEGDNNIPETIVDTDDSSIPVNNNEGEENNNNTNPTKKELFEEVASQEDVVVDDITTEEKTNEADNANNSYKQNKLTSNPINDVAVEQKNTAQDQLQNRDNVTNVSSKNSENTVVSTDDTKNNKTELKNSPLFEEREADIVTEKNSTEKALAENLQKNNMSLKDATLDKEANAVTTEIAAEEKADPNKGLSLEEAIAEAAADSLEESLDKKDIKRWSVAPYIAPVYFNSFGNGSAVDPQFNNNPRSGDINMSYGVAANYHINEKLSVRGGVNKLNLGYSTNNVVVYNNIDVNIDDVNPLRNIRLNSYGQNLSFLSFEGAGFAQVPDLVADNISSSIDQEFSYIEVPLEVEYRLTDKKLSMSVIGGFSTLFLDENKVYTTLQGQQRLLGEATNLNETSFSANVGLGFDYKVSKQIDINLDPMFKYQINTFSNTSGDFNPYIIGIYTGFRFRF